MSDSDWEVADARPDASLSHRSCPWGGHLIKIDLKMPGYDPPVGRQTWLEKSKVPQVDTSNVFCAKNMCHRSFSEVAIPPVTIPPFAHFRGKPARFCVGCAFGFTFFFVGVACHGIFEKDSLQYAASGSSKPRIKDLAFWRQQMHMLISMF